MADVVIVAIPKNEDHVWNISSEKTPHLTLLNLGDALSDQDLARVMQYVEHTVNTSLRRFGLSVDRRGPLGKDEADVLFFTPHSWDEQTYESIQKFRSYLLKNDRIKTAYDVAPQFEGWVPHLTLGYPSSPAKPDTREYPGIHYVDFDRIAIWVDDFSGPEFELKSQDSVAEIAMSAPEEEKIEHVGVKGMKWGVRRSREERANARAAEAQKHADHVRARSLMKKRVSELSNEELSFINNRRNLETNYTKLNPGKSARRKKKIENHLKTLDLIEKTFTATQQPVAQKVIKKAAKKATSPHAKKILKALIKP